MTFGPRTCHDCPEPALLGRSRCAVHLTGSIQAVDRYRKSAKGKAQAEKLKPYLAKWRRENRRGKGRFGYAKGHAKRKGLEWKLTQVLYLALIKMHCNYCELPNDVEAGIGLDRLDNTKGYIHGNVVSCCITCNYVRGDRFTPAEMKIMGAAVRQIRLSRNQTMAPP